MDLRKLVRWELLSIAIWMTFGLVNGTQVVVGMHAEGMSHPWARLFAVYALSWALWAVVSPAVLTIIKRYPIRRYWPVHIITYLTIGIADAGWTVSLGEIFKPMGPNHHMDLVQATISFFYSKFHLELLAYVGLIGLAGMMESRQTLAERDEQLSKARLDALIRQLQPHFLFNTLNGIAGLVRTGDNKTAVSMIAGLSDLLRRVVDGRVGADSSLSEEMSFVHKYLDLQKMRFSDRLRITYDIPTTLANVRVPTMILQPLLENALDHGISRSVSGGAIMISAKEITGRVILTILNDGPAISSFTEGVGLANTRARLRGMYGDAARFDIRNNAAGLVEAVVTVPIHV
jgi:two-component system LytT family sensor kinase